MKFNGVVVPLVALALVVSVPVALVLSGHKADLGFVIAAIVPVGTAVLSVFKAGAS